MASIKEFSTCPICGHHNWCGSRPVDGEVAGALLYFCHYQTGPAQSVVTGVDGRDYVLIKENSSGDGWILETMEQREESRRIWREQQGKLNNFTKCPICGSEDCCTSYTPKNSSIPNAVMYLCHGVRNGKKGSSLVGRDGTEYRLVGETQNGAWKLETVEQHRRNVDAWKARQSSGSEWKLPDGTVVPPVQTNSVCQTSTQELVQKKPEKKVMVAPHCVENVDNIRSNRELDKAYHIVTDMLHLLPHHREKLIQDGWTDELIRKYRIVSMPLTDKDRWHMEHEGKRMVPAMSLPWRNAIVKELQRQLGEDLSGIPGFYLGRKVDKHTGEIRNEWRMAGPEGMMFFSRDIHGHMFGAEIRLDNPGTKGKYRGWSTNPEKEDKSGNPLYPGGTKLPDQAGIVFNQDVDNTYVAYITEGFKKAILGNAYKHCPFVVLKGVGKINNLIENADESLIMIDYLKSIGTKMLIFAFDADKNVNANVLRHEQRGIALMKEHGFSVGVADWSMHAAYAKGIDDLLVQGLDCTYVPM